MRLTGIASTNRTDLVGQRVLTYAFATQIYDPASIPLLWEHAGEPIGTIQKLYYDAKDRLIIECVTFDTRARKAKGFSVGYKRRGWQLLEISLHTAPRNPDCIITKRDTGDLRKLTPAEQYDKLIGLELWPRN